MRLLYRIYTMLCTLLLFADSNAQVDANGSLLAMYKAMPMPVESATESVYQTYFQLLNSRRDEKVQRLYARFLEQLRDFKTNPGKASHYSPEERKMLLTYQRESSQYDEEGRLSLFKMMLEERPLAMSGKLSWNRLPTGAAADDVKDFQQMLAVEKSFDWILFAKEADLRDPVKHPFLQDPVIAKLNSDMATEREKIPKVRRKIFEGMDGTAEVDDPEKMRALIEKYETKRVAILTENYDRLYQWWEKYQRILAATVERLDQCNGMLAKGGNDEGVCLLGVDLQERLLGVVTRMAYFSEKLTRDAQLIDHVKTQKAEMLALYENQAHSGLENE
jgi:hypothetical protein